MGKKYRAYQPEQSLLLPPSLREWLPESHLVYFVSDVVDQLDLSAIERHYEGELRGYPPYDPRLMTKLLVYGLCVLPRYVVFDPRSRDVWRALLQEHNINASTIESSFIFRI